MAPLDPWIIEEILRREREKKEEQDRARIELPLEDGSERPEMPSEERKPGYETPSPNDPKRDERPTEKKEDESQRGVTTIDIGGGDRDEGGDDAITIDISKLPDVQEGDVEGDKRPE